MFNFNLTINQAVHNTEILHYKHVVFTADSKGNLSCIYNFNLIGRLINFIKNLIEGTGEHKVNKVILATFETINQYAKNHPVKPIWTYPVEDSWGMDFDIGFDKVAMRVLMDYTRFENSYYFSPQSRSDDTRIKIRKAAYEVLLMATDQRKQRNIDFDTDH